MSLGTQSVAQLFVPHSPLDVIGRNHNTRTNKTEKHRAKEFLYKKIAFTMAFRWDRRRLPNALSRRLKSSFFFAVVGEYRATLKSSSLFSPAWLRRQTRSILAGNRRTTCLARVKAAFALHFLCLFLLFLVPKLDYCLFLHNFRSRGRLTYYYRGTGECLWGQCVSDCFVYHYEVVKKFRGHHLSGFYHVVGEFEEAFMFLNENLDFGKINAIESQDRV